MDKRIYYVSNYDNEVHNINNVDHKKLDDNNAFIGEETEDGFEIFEEVNLWTILEIAEFFKE